MVAGPELADPDEAARKAVRAQERQADLERSRCQMMRGYAELRDCRRKYILNYFGEKLEAPCGSCDNCAAGVVADAPRAEPFPLGTRVAHERWGEGLVQRYEADKVVVLFDEVGYKTLDAELVAERGLVTPID